MVKIEWKKLGYYLFIRFFCCEIKFYLTMCRIFLTYVLFMLFYSCEKQSEETHCVTYHVTCCGGTSGKMLISYRDTTGYVIFSTSEKTWSRDVCLSYGDYASLLVVYQPVFDREEENLFLYDLLPESNNVMISGQIIHPKKTVCERRANVVLINLFSEEL
jgi:hypothetical protein